jgi:S1-C subfamily serine protease
MNAWKKRSLAPVVAILCLCGGLLLHSAPPDPTQSEFSFADLKLPANARLGASLTQLSRELELLAPAAAWKPSANRRDENPRGLGQDLYPKIAPSVVVVRNPRGHGTGFVIDPDGWILTNEHVVAPGEIDPKTGALRLMIHFGQLKDGQMQPLDQGVPALVYKESPAKDLALLKLLEKPPGLDKLPAIPLSAKKVEPGLDCVAIGHPAAAVLWTLRSGQVVGIGNWPEDMIDVVMQRLALSTKEDRDSLKDALAKVEMRKVVISSCGLNPGDSGGPLVNDAGELIAVSFAIPTAEKGVNLDKFSYHVHLDEVKDFLKDVKNLPAEPPPHVPDALPGGLYCMLMDLDGDGRPDTLAFGDKRSARPSGLLIDLKEESPRLSEDDLADPIKRKAWKFQFAIHLDPQARTFYDTDGDGLIDLILIDNDKDGKADVVLRRQDNRWILEKGDGRPMVDTSLFKDKSMRARLEKILKRVRDL